MRKVLVAGLAALLLTLMVMGCTNLESILVDNGSASSPSVSFTNDTDTGLYRAAANTLGVSAGGSQVGQWTSSGLVKGSYFTIACKHEGQETATLDPICTFQMPFAATLVEVSAAARDIDTASGDETYKVDVEEAGTSVLNASKVALTADNTPVVGTISDSSIADNAKIEVLVTLAGTTPTIDDLFVLLTFRR